jgi:hypothetical protein
VAPTEQVLARTLEMTDRHNGPWGTEELASPRDVPPWGAF